MKRIKIIEKAASFLEKGVAFRDLVCYNILRWQTSVRMTNTSKTSVFITDTNGYDRRKGYEHYMVETTGYFVVKQKAVPEVLLKVVEAKRLLETEKVMTIQEAVDKVGISRSSFYKYKDDIFQFHDNSQGTTLTLTFQMDDEPGLLSDVLKIIAEFGANILTIHQSIPINGIASLSLSIQVLPTTGDISRMLETMEQQSGVHYVKIIAKE